MTGRPFIMVLSVVFICSMLVPSVNSTIPYMEEWGIYELELETGNVQLLYGSVNKIESLNLNPDGTSFAFTEYIGGDGYDYSELCTTSVDGSSYQRLTDNQIWDVYAVWSPDGSTIAYLSKVGETLDIYLMDIDGGNQRLLYDSGYHDSDINWVDGMIAFTRNSQIWVMNSDGTAPRQVTDPPRAGEWGEAVLPYGDYDPRISPDGDTIVFERMVDDSSVHGNYDLFSVNVDGNGLTRLTETGWTQGLVSWSHDGSRFVFMVSAVGEEGRYDLYTMNADDSGIKDLTSEIFPSTFLAHSPVFSVNDESIYFIGQWWDWHVLESEISCMLVDASDDGYELDEVISFKGSIDPAVENAVITLTVNGPDNVEETTQVYTDEYGEYSVSWKPVVAGSWTVLASWVGDAGHGEGESSPVSFTVKPETTVPDIPEDSNGGIPGFPLSSIISSIIIVLFLYHKRGIGP